MKNSKYAFFLFGLFFPLTMPKITSHIFVYTY